jgi:hypothetical protein
MEGSRKHCRVDRDLDDDRESLYYVVFSKGRDNTQDSDMIFQEKDLKSLTDLGLLMCSRYMISEDGVSRNEIWRNTEQSAVIGILDQYYINAGMPKALFDGLLFLIQDPFAIDRIFRQLQKIKYTSAKCYHSDANMTLTMEVDTADEYYSEYLSIFMTETNDDKDVENHE